MGIRKEYTENIIVSKSEVFKMKDAQFNIKEEGFKNLDEGTLVDTLSTSTSILSLAFMLPTPVTLGAGVISAATAASTSEREMIIDVCQNGSDYLYTVYRYMKNNPQYDLVKVELPFLEFVDEDFRIVHGDGYITAVHSDGGWQTV